MNTDWQKMVLVPCLQLAIKYKPDFPIINHFMLRTRSFNPQERADETLQSIPVIPDSRSARRCLLLFRCFFACEVSGGLWYLNIKSLGWE